MLDGAYGAMLNTIRNGDTPTFLLLEYSKSWSIRNFTAIHHSLITEQSIIPRKPLSATAKRAGWVGCSILLPEIATEAKINIVSAGNLEPKELPRSAYRRLEPLAALSSEQRGWVGSILKLIDSMPENVFHLSQLYAREEQLKLAYPNNNNIKAKIRQQLQVLRDAGLIVFFGGGRYGVTTADSRRSLGQLV